MRTPLKPLPFDSKLQRYDSQARSLLHAFKAELPQALHVIRQFHPRLPGRPNTNDRNPLTPCDIRKARVTLADCRAIVAGWHAFESWPTLVEYVAAVGQKNSAAYQFESAVEAIIHGREAQLKTLLRRNPDLIRARSSRGHRATLLHYVGSNGVEGYRQKAPKNTVRIAKILLTAGAEIDADFDYGSLRKIYPERSGSTTLAMVATSCHPANTGVQIELLATLLKHGASPDGLAGAFSPVVAALHNGRGDAASYLAKRGARLDLEAAAGVGRLDVVKTFFNAAGGLKSNATKAQMEHGFMWACEYGHANVVEFLLKSGTNVNAQPHGETGLHWASYQGHARIVKALLRRKPYVSIRDRRFDGTPLGWALYGWCNPSPEANRRGYYEVVTRLVAAGATVDKSWLAASRRGTPMVKKLQADKRMLKALSSVRFSPT